MKNLIQRFSAIALLALSLTSPGCSISKEYVAADKATYDAIAPEYLKYVGTDATLDAEQKARRERTIKSWKLRIDGSAE